MRTQLKPHLCLADVNRIRNKTSIFHHALEFEALDCMKILCAHATKYGLLPVLRDSLNARGMTVLAAADDGRTTRTCHAMFNEIAKTLPPHEGSKFLYDSSHKKSIINKEHDDSAKGKGKGGDFFK